MEYPTHGQVRVSNELKKQDFQISAGGIRSIWLRHKLETKGLRLKRLEKWAAENNGILPRLRFRPLRPQRKKPKYTVR